jgi:hypothetical protein
MMKETPHDFFLTHPDDKFAGSINRPTLIEFDTGNEFNGQGIIANTWPEYVIRRCRGLMNRPNVIGYVARTDRYRDTRIVGTPNEILLLALKRYTEDQSVTPDIILDEFIGEKYGKDVIRFIKPAFKASYDIISSSLYTLGTNIANHSKMDFDPYKSSYGRHVSGKWLDPPMVFVEHNVNVEFQYWKDIIEHLAPARLKTSDGPVLKEAPEVIANKWITAKEQMNETFLRYIIEEKKYGVRRAEEALSSITGARSVMDKEKYEQVFELFSRTLITARLYEAAATSYFAYRIYARGEKFRTPWLEQTLNESLRNLIKISAEIDKYEGPVSRGQWNWRGDSETAREYYDKITNTGWKEYGNVVFKMN